MNISQISKIRDIDQRKRIMELVQKYERDPHRNVILDKVINNMVFNSRKGEANEQGRGIT